MKSLQRTIPGGTDLHYHICYVNDEVPLFQPPDPNVPQDPSIPPQPVVFQTTVADDHSHQYYMDPVSGQWVIVPSEFDGHTHAGFEDYVGKKSKKAEKDEEIIRDVHNLYKASCEYWADFEKEAQKADDFYCGKQWSEEEKSYLEGLDRACLVINDIERHINELCGHQREMRTDIKFTPLEDGDQRVCDLLNIINKHIDEQCIYEREESKAFEDGAIVGIGWLDTRISFDSDLRGDVVTEYFPWDEVKPGPFNKEDLSDCEYLTKEKWYSKAKLEQLYPSKKGKLNKDYNEYLTLTPKTETQYTHDHYGKGDWSPFVLGETGTQLIDIAKKEYRVLECWRRVYNQVSVAANANDDVYLNLHGWKSSDINAVGTIPGFEIVTRMLPQMRITRIAGKVVLSDENPADLCANDYFIVPFIAKKRRNQIWGKVKSAIDPQREKNKRHSQTIDIGNKMAAYGWIIDDTTFPDSAEAERFKRQSSSPGFVTVVNDLSKIPHQVEGAKFPSELVQLMQISSQQLDAMMNVVVQPQGANDSGAKILTLQKQKLTSNEFLFDNLNFAKKKLGRLRVALIQRYYDPIRIHRIVANKNAKQPVDVGGQPFSDFTQDEILKLLEASDLSKCDVAVTEGSFSPTTRLANFLLFGELAKGGLPISPATLLRWADMPESERQKAIQDMQAQMQQQAQAEATKGKSEVQKALIGQGIIPPDVQSEMGVQSNGPIRLDEQNIPGQQGGGIPSTGTAPQQQGNPDTQNIMQMLGALIAKPPTPVNVTVENKMPTPSSRRVGVLSRDEATGTSTIDVQDVPEPDMMTQ